MGLLYTLTDPVKVGDLQQSIPVSSLQLVSISINYEPAHADQGTAILSINLIDPVSKYPVNIVYQDASALAMARLIESQIGPEILLKLANDGKLPAGTISTT